MCESKVFLIKNGKREEVMENATLVRAKGDSLIIIGNLGEKKTLRSAEIIEVDIDRHEIYIKEKKR